MLTCLRSGEPLFATPCCNTSRATWSTPSEPSHVKPFFEVLSFSALVHAAVVNLFVLNLVCFISVCPCIPETGRLKNTYSCCGFWLWSWLAAAVNLFVLKNVRGAPLNGPNFSSKLKKIGAKKFEP